MVEKCSVPLCHPVPSSGFSLSPIQQWGSCLFLSWFQAWKKRWFVLRSGRMSGDPDVLEYYKNDHSKKPLRVINLNFCEQVDAGLTFNKKELQDSYIFDIKTSDRTFYLVAETEDDMNKWVRSICQICGFNQSEENTGTMRDRPMAESIFSPVLPMGPGPLSDQTCRRGVQPATGLGELKWEMDGHVGNFHEAFLSLTCKELSWLL